MAIERSDSDSILMIMCLASAGGTITPTGIRIMVSYLDQTGLEHTLEKTPQSDVPGGVAVLLHQQHLTGNHLRRHMGALR